MAKLEAGRRRVVVVDDEPLVLEVVCDVLQEVGVEPTGCSVAMEAFWRIHREPPDLVILDVGMPGLDGLRFLQQLRADPATAELPVLFLTANSERVQQEMPDYQAWGAELLPKPFAVETLITMVERLLGR